MSPSAGRLRAAWLTLALVLLGGCGAQVRAAEEVDEPYTLHAEGGASTLTVDPRAVDWLGIRTEPVTAASTPGLQLVPLAAVLYGPDGTTFVYTHIGDGYQRHELTVDHIDGSWAVVVNGPGVGTPVVTQAAAELAGMQFGLEDE